VIWFANASARRIRQLRRHIAETVDWDRVTRVVGEGLDSVRQALEEVAALRSQAQQKAAHRGGAEQGLTEVSKPPYTLRRTAAEIVARYASLAAANAFNPFPGLDIGVDIGILLAMSRGLVSLYDLSSQQREVLDKRCGGLASHHRPLGDAAERLTHQAVERLVLAMVSRVVPEVVAHWASKWLPLVGAAVSAHTRYRIASNFGTTLCTRCEELMALEAIPPGDEVTAA
jgi:hypothetical protein